MNVVIVNCFDTYEQRVNMLYDFFKERKDDVKVYTSNYKHIDKEVRTNPPRDYIYIPAIKYKKNLSMKRIVSHIKYAKKIFKAIPNESIDILWVLLPPNSLAKEAADYKRKHPKTKLIFDVIDMWPETMPVAKVKNMKAIKKWGELRDKNLEAADYVVTECNLFKEIIEKNTIVKKIKTVYFAKDSIKVNTNIKLPEDRISLCYLGSINNIIDISTIANIIKEISEKKPVELHIIGDGESRDDLINESTEAGAKVFYYGKIYDQAKKQEILDRCHFGLNIMKDTVCVGLTMKSLDYFNAGIPIINNIRGDTWNLVNNYKAGINIREKIENISFKNGLKSNSKKLFEENLSRNIFNNDIEEVIRKA